MAGLYDTPGSAVAETIQAILQRRREMERQAMLDTLGVEKFRADETDREASRKHQDEQLALQREQEIRMGKFQDAQMKDMDARRADQLYEDAPMHVEDPSQLPDELRDIMTQRGRIIEDPTTFDYQAPIGPEPTPAEEVSSIDRALQGGGQRDLGSSKYQETEDARRRIEEFRGSVDSSSQNPLDIILGGAAAGVNIPGQALPPRKSKNTVVGPTGNVIREIEGTTDDTVTELPYEPRTPTTPTALLPRAWTITDQSTGTNSTFVGTVDEVDALISSNTNLMAAPTGTARQADPNAQTPVQRAAAQYIAVVRAARTPDKPQAVQAAAQRIIAATPVSPSAHALMQEVLTNFAQWSEAGRPLPPMEAILDTFTDEVPNFSDGDRLKVMNTLQIIMSGLGQQPGQ